MNDLHQIIKKIRLSEKASLAQETLNEYIFQVDCNANKIQIKQAVETFYGKKVVSVNTANYAGKLRRQRTAYAGRANHWKKAVVKLAEGESIDLV